MTGKLKKWNLIVLFDLSPYIPFPVFVILALGVIGIIVCWKENK